MARRHSTRSVPAAAPAKASYLLIRTERLGFLRFSKGVDRQRRFYSSTWELRVHMSMSHAMRTTSGHATAHNAGESQRPFHFRALRAMARACVLSP